MDKFIIIPIATVLVFVIIAIVLILLLKKTDSEKKKKINLQNDYGYQLVNKTTNVRDLQNNFVFDNPQGNGTDPTGGSVDYSYPMQRDQHGNIIENINGNIFWGEIPNNPKLISNVPGGFKIEMTKKLINGNAGSVRLMSRKLYRGGLFVFDVEHTPMGCGIWPALWLNGFVGGTDQYHEKKGTKKYNEGMDKLVKSTLGTGTRENYDKTCGIKSNSLSGIKDPYLSEYLGKDIYVGNWPMGGEIDILEQINFSATNTVSVHGGPKCELTSEFNDAYTNPYPNADYQKYGLRSVCGWAPLPDPPNWSGCKTDEDMIAENGPASQAAGHTTLPNGETRPNCYPTGYASGNAQVTAPNGSFGEVFNATGGGVYVLEWIPKKRIFVWWYPRSDFDESSLSREGGPLSSNPDPSLWLTNEYPSTRYAKSAADKVKTLIVSYILDDENAITEGCDFNYQGIILNITMGGGWGSNTPTYCSVNNNSNFANYAQKCYSQANVDRAIANKGNGWDPANGCYDGAYSNSGRGINAKPVFYSEAYFKIRNISVFQKEGQDNVW